MKMSYNNSKRMILNFISFGFWWKLFDAILSNLWILKQYKIKKLASTAIRNDVSIKRYNLTLSDITSLKLYFTLSFCNNNKK